MKCQEARQLLSAYLDSSLDETVTFRIMRHLEECPSCSSRFSVEQRLEQAIQETLRRPSGDEEEIVRRALVRAGIGRRLSSRRSWAAALIVVLLATAVFGVDQLLRRSSPPVPDLVVAAAQDHRKFVSGDVGPDLPSENPDEVNAFLARELSTAMPQVPAGNAWKLLGVRKCHLKEAWVGFIMLRFNSTPVSLFVISPEEAKAFPDAAGIASRNPCFPVGEEHAVLSTFGDHLLCAVGNVPVPTLEELTRRP